MCGDKKGSGEKGSLVRKRGAVRAALLPWPQFGAVRAVDVGWEGLTAVRGLEGPWGKKQRAAGCAFSL